MRIDYRKMIPEPEKRLKEPCSPYGWNLIGKTTLSDIDRFILIYRREHYQTKCKNIPLQNICKDMHKTRALFLDILMSILWSRIAIRNMYHATAVTYNTVYSIDALGHMMFLASPNDKQLTCAYHFALR